MVLTPDPCPSSPPGPHAMTGKESVSSSVRNLVTFKVMSGIPGANVIKHFTAVIYRCSMVIQSFCVIKLYYYGKYCGMLVSNTMVIYGGILTLGKVATAVNYHGIFITLAKDTTVL